MRHLLSDLMSFLMPKRCFYCKHQLLGDEKHLCLTCEFTLPKHHKEILVNQLFDHSSHIHSINAFLRFQKTGISQSLIHNIKYNSNTELASYVGALFAHKIESEPVHTADFLIPVPLHAKKLKERGFNQSNYFALGIEKVLQIPIDNTSLQRIRYTESQTHKDKEERRENVKDCFKLSNEAKFTHKHIVLLDDVITTGATLEACVHAFRHVEGIKISILCMAMA